MMSIAHADLLTIGSAVNSGPVTDPELLSAAIKVSRLSVRQFARDVLVRDPRSVWRWLAGETKLPAAVRQHCERLLASAPSDDASASDPASEQRTES
jgi:hypothetical protein